MEDELIGLQFNIPHFMTDVYIALHLILNRSADEKPEWFLDQYKTVLEAITDNIVDGIHIEGFNDVIAMLEHPLPGGHPLKGNF